MRPLVLLLSLCALAGRHCAAQLVEDVRSAMAADAVWVVKLDTHGSFIGNESVTFAGVKVGREHAGRLQYGIGYSFLFSPVHQEQRVDDGSLVTTRLRLGYATPYFEYAFYQRGPWELRIPVQLGLGGGSLVYDDAGGRTRVLQHTLLFTYEPGIAVQYRFLKYFALGAGWGYRLVLRSAHLSDGLTAPTYSFGLRVFFGDLWKDIRPATAGAP